MSSIAVLPGLVAHRSGALWIPESQTALVADLHLGYSWAQRRRGELGPLADERTRQKLFAAIDELRPREIVFLGDIVHAPRPCAAEREWIEQTVTELSRRAALTAVRGNHDRAFAREFSHLPITVEPLWSNGGVIAIHGDRLDLPLPEPRAATLVLGHIHPSLSIKDASGAGRKLPVFVASPRALLLPAFSPFAGGFYVGDGLPSELQPFFEEPVEVYAAAPSRVVRLGPLRETVERMYEADVSAPERFRKRRA